MADDIPEFDPSKPFEPVGSAVAPEFDPSKPFEPVTAESKQSLSWSEVPGQVVSNVGPSAVEFGKNLVQPIIHPVETAQNVGAIGGGVLQQLGLMKGEEYKPYSEAVGKFLMNRYGSAEGIKHTLATDPVGMAADVATVLTGGGGLAARAPGLIGRAGEIAGTVGRVVDPLSAVGAGAKVAGKLGTEALGVSTGVGPEAIRTAAQAGVEGGEAARAFRQNIRGIVPTEDAVADARSAVSNLRQQRSAAYKEGMKAVGEIDKPLDFDKIDAALADATRVKTFHGQIISAKTQDIRQEIGQAVATWKSLDPAVFHTPEGLDALKQKIGDIRDSTQFDTPQRIVADQAYRAIRQTIVDEAPQYAKTMKGYEEATDQIKTLERELSIPNTNRGNVDTALRKLQSVLRNNVNASFGRRRELAQFLIDNGSPNLLYKLAGQTLQPIAPRGLARLHTMIGAELAAMLGVGLTHGPGLAAVAPTAALMSPRAVGEAAYWSGRAYGATPKGLGLPVYQAGRLGTIHSPLSFKAGGRVTKSFRYPR